MRQISVSQDSMAHQSDKNSVGDPVQFEFIGGGLSNPSCNIKHSALNSDHGYCELSGIKCRPLMYTHESVGNK